MIDLNSLSYVIDDNLNDMINNNIFFDIEDEVKNYFSLKADYLSFLNNIIYKKNKSSVFNSSYRISKDIISNYPLEFIETNDCLTINIIDDITRKPVFQKNIYLSKQVEIYSRIQYLTNLLNKHNYGKNKYALKNKLNNFKVALNKTKILRDNEIISDEDYEFKINKFNSEEIILKDEYNNLIKNIKNYVNELEILNDIINDKNNKLDEYFKTYLNHDIYLKIKNRENVFNALKTNKISDDFFINYTVLNAIQNQRISDKKGSIAFNKKDNQFVILDEDVNSNASIIKIKFFNKNINLIPITDIILFEGVFYKMNFKVDSTYFVDVNYINKKLSEKGYDTIYKDYNLDIKFSNFDGKKEYVKKDGIQYLNTVTIIESDTNIKEINEKNIKVKDTDLVTNLYNKDENTRFVLYKISSKYPGDATFEIIKRDVKKSLKYEQLFNIPNWRRILMDTYIHRDQRTNNIYPIILDGNKFASVEHYLYYCKYINQPGLDGPKLEQYNNYAKRFMLTYDLNSFGGDDADTLYDKDNSGFKVRSDYDDYIIKEYVKILYAKFTQNPAISNALVLTKDSLITTLNRNSTELNTMVNLMRVRKMLIDNITPEFYKNMDDDRLLYYKVYDRIARPQVYEEKKKETNLIKLEGFYNVPIYEEDGMNFKLIAIYMDDESGQIFGLYDNQTNKIEYFEDMDMDTPENIKLMEEIEVVMSDITINDIRLEKINYLIDDKNIVYIEKNNKLEELGELKIREDNTKFIEFK